MDMVSITTLEDVLARIVRTEVRSEIAGLSRDVQILTQDMETVKYTLGNQAMQLGALRLDATAIKQTVRAQGKDLHQLAVLFEDLDDRFEISLEAR